MRKAVIFGCIISCVLLIMMPCIQCIQEASIKQVSGDSFQTNGYDQTVASKSNINAITNSSIPVIETILLSIDNMLPSLFLSGLSVLNKLYEELKVLSNSKLCLFFEITGMLLLSCYLAASHLPTQKCISHAKTVCGLFDNLRPVFQMPLKMIAAMIFTLEPFVFLFSSLIPMISFILFSYSMNISIFLFYFFVILLPGSFFVSTLFQISPLIGLVFLLIFFIPSYKQVKTLSVPTG